MGKGIKCYVKLVGKSLNINMQQKGCVIVITANKYEQKNHGKNIIKQKRERPEKKNIDELR